VAKTGSDTVGGGVVEVVSLMWRNTATSATTLGRHLLSNFVA